MIFIGIDPGGSGGIAWLDESGNVVKVMKMPETDADVLEALGQYIPAKAVIERVAAFAPAGMRMGATSAFTFGRGVGALHMALTACQIPFEPITPLFWQKFMACRTGGDKNVSKAKAQQLFPSLKITHAIADALLIAEFCRRRHLQGPPELDSEETPQSIQEKKIRRNMERMKAETHDF